MATAATEAAHHQGKRSATVWVALVQLVALTGAVALIVLTAGECHWSVVPLLVIATFTIISDVTCVQTGSAGLVISGSGLGLVLAAVLLGGGPAALVGVLSISVGWLHSREEGHEFLNNLVAYAWSPLLAGLFFLGATESLGLGPHSFGYYLLVFATYLIALTVNFMVIAGYTCYLARESLIEKTRDAFIPLLSAQLFSALLAMGAVYLAIQLGLTGLAALGLTFVIFQYLVGELLKSKRAQRGAAPAGDHRRADRPGQPRALPRRRSRSEIVAAEPRRVRGSR